MASSFYRGRHAVSRARRALGSPPPAPSSGAQSLSAKRAGRSCKPTLTTPTRTENRVTHTTNHIFTPAVFFPAPAVDTPLRIPDNINAELAQFFAQYCPRQNTAQSTRQFRHDMLWFHPAYLALSISLPRGVRADRTRSGHEKVKS